MTIDLLTFSDEPFLFVVIQFPFFTLVCFDPHQMGLPVAWCIQQRETAEMICLFLQAVKDRALKVKADWNPNCFIIDCADAEVSAIKTVFSGIPIYFCSWHVRRYNFTHCPHAYCLCNNRTGLCFCTPFCTCLGVDT